MPETSTRQGPGWSRIYRCWRRCKPISATRRRFGSTNRFRNIPHCASEARPASGPSPATEAAFVGLVKFARRHALPLFVIGRGSNLLVRDGGIDGLVIHPNGGDFARIEVNAEALELTAGAARRPEKALGSRRQGGRRRIRMDGGNPRRSRRQSADERRRDGNRRRLIRLPGCASWMKSAKSRS